MKSLRITAVILAVATIAGALSIGCSKKKQSAAAAFPDSVVSEEVIVTVNTEPVLGSDLMVFAYTTTAASPDSLKNVAFNERLLEQMIGRVAFSQEAKAAGVAIADTLVEAMLKQFVQQFGGEERVAGMLAEMGLKRADVAKSFHRDMVIRSYVQTKVEPSIVINEADSRAYYEQNQASFAPVDSVRARHIIFMFRPDDPAEKREEQRKLITELRKRAKGGEDFAQLAQQFSQDGAAQSGGDLGYFPRGVMVKPFEDAVFALKKGQISDVVETQFGFHLIQCVDRKDARKVTYDEVRSRVDAVLRQRALASELENRLKRNREAAIIVKNYETGA